MQHHILQAFSLRSELLSTKVTAGDAALALVATAARLYVFLGGPGLQGAFSGYASRAFGVHHPHGGYSSFHPYPT